MAENKPEIMIIEDSKVQSYLIEIIEDEPEDKPVEKIDRRKIKKIKPPKEVKPVEAVEKIDKRKILRAPWRTTILEDGTKKYNKKPTDPLYYQKYYDTVRKDKESIIITCELCRRRIACGHIHRHQRSIICKKFYNLRLIKEAEEKSTEDDDDAKSSDHDDDAKSSDHDDDDK
jgi:hypothetical protein